MIFSSAQMGMWVVYVPGFFFFQRKLHVLETVMWLQTFSFSLIWFKIAYKYPVYKVLNSELPHYISLPMILLSINLITNSTKFKISGQLCVYNLLPGKLMKSVLLFLKNGFYLLNYKWFSVVIACWFQVYLNYMYQYHTSRDSFVNTIFPYLLFVIKWENEVLKSGCVNSHIETD